MKNRKFLNIGLISLTVVLGIAVIVTLLNVSINHALKNDAERTGVNWSKHISQYVPNIGDHEHFASLGNIEAALRKKHLAYLALDIVLSLIHI